MERVREIENECAEEMCLHKRQFQSPVGRRVQRSVVAHVDDLVALEVLDVLLERAHLGLDALLAQLLGHSVDHDGERLVLVV